MADGETYGNIFDIQRFAVHDGPGIRTTVFFKGCSNKCGWCHNPESLTPGARLRYYESRCAGCGKCAEACPQGAHVFTDAHVFTGADGAGAGRKHNIDREKCTGCGACVGACYYDALALAGRRVSAAEAMREILEDAPYYEASGGGVTLSGGEPVLQREFAGTLLNELKANNIHTNIQTAGNYPFEYLEGLLPLLDMVMYDVKGISEDIYARHIGGGRERMLNNLKLLDAAAGARAFPIVVRTPVVVGVNATEAEITAVAEFIKPLLHLESYRLIPYHGLGRAKYDSMGIPYENDYASPSNESIKMLEAAAAKIVPVSSYK